MLLIQMAIRYLHNIKYNKKYKSNLTNETNETISIKAQLQSFISNEIIMKATTRK